MERGGDQQVGDGDQHTGGRRVSRDVERRDIEQGESGFNAQQNRSLYPQNNVTVTQEGHGRGGSQSETASTWQAQAYPARTSKGRSSTMDSADTRYYSMLSDEFEEEDRDSNQQRP